MRLYIFKNNSLYLFIGLSLLVFIAIYYYQVLENFKGGGGGGGRWGGTGSASNQYGGILDIIPSRVIYIILGLFGGAVVLGALMQYFSPKKIIKNSEFIDEKTLNRNVGKKNLTPVKATATN